MQLADEICERRGPESFECKEAKPLPAILPAKVCAIASEDTDALFAHMEAMRVPCAKLVTNLCSDIGEGSRSCKLVRDKTPQFPAAQCSKMLANYDTVLRQLKDQERRHRPLTATEAVRVRSEGEPPRRGAEDARVGLTLFADFECEYCGKLKPIMAKLLEAYGDRVQFQFRHFPIGATHEHAGLAAEAAVEAHVQGKFWAFHDQLYAHQGELDRAGLERHADTVGLDTGAFRAALDDHRHRATVEADLALGMAIVVAGTPSVIIGDQRVPHTYEELAEGLDRQLAETDPSASP